jgi:hypothetical protein
MTQAPQPWLSLVLPVAPGAAGLRACLASLARLDQASCEVLLVCSGQQALAEAQAWLPEPAPPAWRLIPQAPDGEAGAEAAGAGRALGLAQARGEVVLFLTTACQVPPHLPAALRQALAREDTAGAGLGLRPPAGSAPLAELADQELAWRQSRMGLPLAGCAALRRRDALAAGGLDPALPGPQGDLLALWLALVAQGRELVWGPELHLWHELPASWGGLWRLAWAEGRESSLRARLGGGQAPGLPPGLLGGQGNPRLQALLALLAPAVLAGLWPLDHGRAVTLALICLALLYPLNRPFLTHLGHEAPGLLNQALLYCLVRPFAWLGGMLAAGTGRLGGRGGPSA